MDYAMSDWNGRAMKRSWRALVVLALALVSCARAGVGRPHATVAPTIVQTPAAVSTGVPTHSPLTPQVATIGTEFSAEHAAEHARWLVETIGSRPAGSPEEKTAAEGLAARLQALGFQVALQPFEIETYEDHGTALDVQDSSADPTVLALVNSISNTANGLLVNAGLGRTDDFADLDVRGAIALMERGEIPFADKARNAARAGAIGAVIYNTESGLFRGVIPGRSTIPVAALSGEDGQALVRRMSERALSAELRVAAAVTKGESQNVIADWPGQGEQVLVLGAHYDSVPAGPGANDNASGTATVLELARVLSERSLPVRVRVVFFGAEEIGLNGSQHYVTTLSALERSRILAMLNFDMVGVGDRALVGGDDRLTDVAVDKAAELGARVAEMTGRETGGSDHASFLAAGIPALFFHRQPDPNYHTSEDRVTYLNPAYLQEAAELAQSVIEHLTGRE